MYGSVGEKTEQTYKKGIKAMKIGLIGFSILPLCVSLTKKIVVAGR